MAGDVSNLGESGAGRWKAYAAAMLALSAVALAMAPISALAQPADVASITVILDAVPDDDQDFEFTTSGSPLPASFLLDDDEDFAGSPDPDTLPQAWTSDLVPAGVTYSISQTPVPGWVLASATCDNGDSPAAITPAANQNVTCTFLNEAEPGEISVTKTVEDASGSAWSFEIAIDPVDPGVSSPQSGFGSGSGFFVSTFQPLLLNRSYTLLEPALPGGWAQTSFTCSAPDEEQAEPGYQVTITEPGQQIDCEIVNTTVASITVLLDAVPDDDQDFQYTTSGSPLPASFVLDDDAGFPGSPDPNTLQNNWTSDLVPAGVTYSIAQTPLALWSVLSATCDNGDAPAAITPDPGANVTCTFVNEPDSSSANFRFRVTKDFADDNVAAVEVGITCNTGLALQQSFEIAEGEVVEFVVQNFTPGPGIWCEITEAEIEGYSPGYVANSGSPDAESCYFQADDIFLDNTCEITNTADYVEVEVGKNWLFDSDLQNDFIPAHACIEVRSPEPFQTGGSVAGNFYYKELCFEGVSPAGQSVFIRPSYLGSVLTLTEGPVDKSVQVSNSCGSGSSGSITAYPGGSYDCAFTNTLFFEGIPALNPWSKAVLVLLVLGIGVLGYRRVV